MKKTFLHLLIQVCCIAAATAQITLNQSDFALSTTGRDSTAIKLLKLVGATVPTQGNNQMWDYSTVGDTIPRTFTLGSATQPATTRPSIYSSANLEANTSYFLRSFVVPTRSYYLLNASGYDLLGDSLLPIAFSLRTITGQATDSISFAGKNRPLSPASRLYRFPMTANTTWSVTNVTTTDFTLNVPSYGLFNAAGQQFNTAITKDSIVGWGTLKLKNPAASGVLSFNVLLDARQTITIDSFYLNGQPAPLLLLNAFGLKQGNRDTTIRFRFLGANFKAPYLTVVTNGTGTQVVDIYRAVLPNLGLTSPTTELSANTGPLSIFPNPAHKTLNIQVEMTEQTSRLLTITDLLGKTVLSKKLDLLRGVNQLTLDIPPLASGIYVVKVGNSTQRLMID